MITVPVEVQDLIKSGRAHVRWWWRLETSPVTAIWTGRSVLDYGGFTWQPLPWATPPKFGMMGGDGSVQQTSVDLAVPAGIMDSVFDTMDLGLKTVRAGFWITNSAGQPLFERRLHRGRVDDVQVMEGDNEVAVVRLLSVGRLADARRDGHRVVSDADQRLRDENDGFLKTMGTAQDVEIVIGGRGAAPAAGGAGGGGGAYQRAYDEVSSYR